MSDNEEFVKSLSDATLKIILDMEKKVNLACLAIEGEGKKNCPVDLGILRASITHETESSAKEITGRIGSNLEYAPYVHQGTGIYAEDGTGRKTPWGYQSLSGKHKGFHWTRGQKPQPFLKDAVVSKRLLVEKILGGG